MANYCDNFLDIDGNYTEVKNFLKKLADDEREVCFANILPNFQDETGNTGGSSSDFHVNGVSFYTAYEPPLSFFEHVSKLYPKLTFTLSYFEEEMDLCGSMTFLNGDRIKIITESYDSKFTREFYRDNVLYIEVEE